MIVAAVWLALAAVLLAAAVLKAADRDGTAVALAGYGVPGRLAAPASAGLVAAEAALAAGLAAGSERAAYAAAGLLCVFLAAQATALAQDGAGAPCGCFGAGGRLSRAAAGRTALLASGCALLPVLGAGPGLPLAFVATVAAVAVVVAGAHGIAPRGAL